MKTRNDFNKFGLTTMIGWNILLIVLILIVSTIKGFPFNYISASCFYLSRKALNFNS